MIRLLRGILYSVLPMLVMCVDWVSWPGAVVGCAGSSVTLQWTYNVSDTDDILAFSLYHYLPQASLSTLVLVHLYNTIDGDGYDEPSTGYEGRVWSTKGINVSTASVVLSKLSPRDSGQYELGLAGDDLSLKMGKCKLNVVSDDPEVEVFTTSDKPELLPYGEYAILVKTEAVLSNVSCWAGQTKPSVGAHAVLHLCTPPCVIQGVPLSPWHKVITCEVQAQQCIRMATINMHVQRPTRPTKKHQIVRKSNTLAIALLGTLVIILCLIIIAVAIVLYKKIRIKDWKNESEENELSSLNNSTCTQAEYQE